MTKSNVLRIIFTYIHLGVSLQKNDQTYSDVVDVASLKMEGMSARYLKYAMQVE